ncbi:relaxin-3 receptor 1 [Hippocampus zosterae]|uniref:relaxin-3 receptor 1 n=1 Tax=Hippocampus zosterae TaxID=109293 RepID=UPI00223D3754|nr:relaxin-3 receptor 1 [Hippocampus zosterae]
MSMESAEEGSAWSFNESANATANRSCNAHVHGDDLGTEPGSDGAVAVRIVISVVYSLVCALGLVGNVLVLYLMKSKRAWKKSSINLFVTSLALTDFQFVLTLPFWAVENALDFTWLFGRAMCKTVSYVTAMNMYASVFFLTAMSVARYNSLASALHGRRGGRHSRLLRLWFGRCGAARCVAASIWVAAACAALPHVVFSTTVRVSPEEDLCLVKFPESDGTGVQLWLGLYHSQKVLLGFVAPLGIISACYLLLLRFVAANNDANRSSAKRRAKVTKSVTIVVLSFFLCWLPNQALTAWGILIKLNVVQFTYEYYTTQVYVFPVSVCLAHSNSCLNPVLYCLMRREFRKSLKRLFRRITSPGLTTVIRPITGTTKPEADEQGRGHLAAAAAPRGGHRDPPAVVFYPPGAAV